MMRMADLCVAIFADPDNSEQAAVVVLDGSMNVLDYARAVNADQLKRMVSLKLDACKLIADMSALAESRRL